MIMKKYCFTAAALLLGLCFCLSCSYEPSMEEIAIKGKIEEQKGEVKKFALTEIEKIGEATIGKEIEERTKNFQLKLMKDSEFEKQYRGQGLRQRADEKAAAIVRDIIHIRQMDSIKASIPDRLEELAYREYRFSASCNTSEGPLELKDWYAAITPEGEVLNMVSSKSKLHSGLGVVIPGWKDLFPKKESDE